MTTYYLCDLEVLEIGQKVSLCDTVLFHRLDEVAVRHKSYFSCAGLGQDLLTLNVLIPDLCLGQLVCHLLATKEGMLPIGLTDLSTFPTPCIFIQLFDIKQVNDSPEIKE